jgi:hypothetical protein
MKDPVLPIPVSPPEPRYVSPRLCEGGDPSFFCVWLSETGKRAFATDGKKEREVDYRLHRRWSREAIIEFSEEYTKRMPGMVNPSENESLDGLMRGVCLSLHGEPYRWTWSYLFDVGGGRSYVCVKRYAEEFCGKVCDEKREGYGDAEVVGRIRGMYNRDIRGVGSV